MLTGKWKFWFLQKRFFMDKTRTIGQKWLVNELILFFWPSKGKNLMKIPKVIFHIKPILPHMMRMQKLKWSHEFILNEVIYFSRMCFIYTVRCTDDLSFLHSHHMRRYWFYVKNDFRNFHQIFTFWDPLSQKKRFLRKCLSVCLSVCL